VPAIRDQAGKIVASIPARFVDPAPPFPPFRRLTLRLPPSGEEIAYLLDPEGTDERTYVSLDPVEWSQDAALLSDHGHDEEMISNFKLNGAP
jgi:hypothetical protein